MQYEVSMTTCGKDIKAQKKTNKNNVDQFVHMRSLPGAHVLIYAEYQFSLSNPVAKTVHGQCHY